MRNDMSEAPGNVSRLLHAWAGGDVRARDELVPLVYHELRRRASGYLRQERRDHTLQATALVHEAFMRLAGQDRVAWQNRGHFYAVAAQMMRRILVDYARERRAAKRPNPAMRKDLDDQIAAPAPPGLDIVILDAALIALSKLDPRQAQIRGAAVFRRPLGAGGRGYALRIACDGHPRVGACPRVALSPYGPYIDSRAIVTASCRFRQARSSPSTFGSDLNGRLRSRSCIDSSARGVRRRGGSSSRRRRLARGGLRLRVGARGQSRPSSRCRFSACRRVCGGCDMVRPASPSARDTRRRFVHTGHGARTRCRRCCQSWRRAAGTSATAPAHPRWLEQPPGYCLEPSVIPAHRAGLAESSAEDRDCPLRPPAAQPPPAGAPTNPPTSPSLPPSSGARANRARPRRGMER